MRRSDRTLLWLAMGLVVGLFTVRGATGTAPPEARGVLAGLKVGQLVTLKDVGTAYVVQTMEPEIPTGESVAELGPDYLVVRSQAGVESRIPVTSIKAVVRVTLP